MRKLGVAAISVAALSAFAASTAFAQDTDYVLNTASTGGTYHPVGTAISTLSKVKLLPKEKFSLTAVNSAGSGANVQALGAGTADFAILQGLYGSYAATGTGPVTEPQPNIRAVSMLWQNVEQFIVPNDKVATGTVEDLIPLKGMSAGMGSQNSGTIGSNKILLAGLGIDIDSDFELVYAGYGPTADAMANGQVVVSGIPSGPPTGAITKLMAANRGKFTILDITDEQLAAMDGGRNLWVPYTIAAGTYPGQDVAINTIAQPNFLAVNERVDENHVYLLTKTMYENLPFLQAIHPATKAMSVEKALAGLPVPLHPGGAGIHKEKSQDGKAGVIEKPDNAKDKGANVHREKSNITEKSDDAKDKGARDKTLDGKPGGTDKTDQESHPDSKEFPTYESKRITGAELAESEVQSDSRRVLPPRRRSARIASLSEDNGKEEGESESQKSREKPCEEEAVDNKSISEEAVKAKSNSNIIKRKRKQKILKSESQKKRQRLLSSSTDEELEIQEYISSEEEPEDNGKYISKSKSKQRDIYAKRAKKRALQQTEEDPSVSVPQKKSIRLSKSFNDAPAAQSKETTGHTPLPEESVQKPHRRKSSQPQRLPVRSSQSPPVVITRYNRQIKPNRRYLDTSGEASEAGSEGEDEAGEEKHTPRDSEAYTDIDSSDSEHES